MLRASGLPYAWGGLAVHSRPPVEEAVRAMLKIQSFFYFLLKYLCNFHSKDEFMGVAIMFFCFAKNQNFTDSLFQMFSSVIPT